MSRRRTSSINIRNFIGTTSLRTSRPVSITSMLPRVGVGGSPAFTATYFVPSVSYAIRGHSRDAADVCYWRKATARIIRPKVANGMEPPCSCPHPAVDAAEWAPSISRIEGELTNHFPRGRLTDLFEDQEATVLQLPAQPATAAEAAAQERVAHVG